MNSLSDLLAKQADDLFGGTTTPLRMDTPLPNTSSSDPTPSAEFYYSHPTTTGAVEHAVSLAETLAKMQHTLDTIKSQLDILVKGGNSVSASTPQASTPSLLGPQTTITPSLPLTTLRIIEGVFNGRHMVGDDGKEYPIPPNYASKSKLVEGDLMKLTISPQGSLIYKQIKPIARQRIMGELLLDQISGQWSAIAQGKAYKILTASITFYKCTSGDQVVFLIPQDGSSDWGAMEHKL